MIDWITIRIPCSHATPINGGKFVSISSDGEEEWNTDKFLPVEGSYSSKISIRSLSTDIITDNNRFTHIELSGNPVKFLQGHNIWGTDSLLDLICECIMLLQHSIENLILADIAFISIDVSV